MEKLKSAFSISNFNKKETIKELFEDAIFESALDRNIKTGNFKVVIAGDKIHPNVLGMVEAIQSAPHLSFTIYLAEIQPYTLDDDNLLIQPTIVTKTNEIERSVIRLEIDYKEKKHTIESSSPEKEGKGNKPIQTAEEYLSALSVPDFKNNFRKFWKMWKNLGGDVRFGTIGFSIGINVDGNRNALQFFYDDNFYLVSTSTIEKYGISDRIYEQYKNKLMKSIPKAYDLLVSNKVKMLYKDLTSEELDKVFEVVIKIAEELKMGSEK